MGRRLNFRRAKKTPYVLEFDRSVFKLIDASSQRTKEWISENQDRMMDGWKKVCEWFPFLSRFFEFEVIQVDGGAGVSLEKVINPKLEMYRTKFFWSRRKLFLARNFDKPDLKSTREKLDISLEQIERECRIDINRYDLIECGRIPATKSEKRRILKFFKKHMPVEEQTNGKEKN